ncbi:hypothetical protein EES40_05105 [Streptomyces sp. ADI93-02]|nr:hypothetical protein EES40_05105 [Streptomyces sp. ADI93-02]
MSLLHHGAPRDAFAELSGFRMGLYACLTGRRDALFELSDALLCADGPVRTLVELSLEPEHRRGHGALYGGLNHGDLDMARLRRTLAGLPLPRTSEGRLVLAVDVSTWSRPDANTSPDRMFCHTYGRGRGSAQMIPGWPYSFVAALEQGRTSWTALLDVVRLCPWDDAIAVTAAHVRDVLQRLYVTGQWQVGDPPVLVVLDAGYDVTRLAFLLADLPVELLGRMRSDRVLYFPPPPQPPANRRRKPKRGAEFAFEAAATQPVPSVTTVSDTTHYGKALASAWDRLHPLLVRRSAWVGHPEGELPVIEGTVVRLQVDHLRGDTTPGRSGCGGRAPPQRQTTWTGSGGHSCADSTLNTPSECSSRRWGGPLPNSASRPPPTAGPGSSSHPTLNSALPGPSQKTSAIPGNGPPVRGASHSRASVEDFAASTGKNLSRSAHRNPASRAPASQSGRRTSAAHASTPSGNRTNQTSRKPPQAAELHKRQA